MDSNWIVFILVWMIVEFIEYLRKKPFRKRMKTGAIWATILSSLSLIGAISSKAYAESPWLSLAVAVGMNGIPALGIYWLRVGLARAWSRISGASA